VVSEKKNQWFMFFESNAILLIKGGIFMYLNKEQFCLLKRICSCEEMSYSSLSNQEKITSEFLCNERFISISRESFPHFSGEKVSYRYGEPIFVKITEQGKSYIAERKHEFTKLLFKDILIPVAVSIITNLLILGLKLLQHWLLPQG
jgi:hypothetical protein